jgi:hypothetical protein
MKAYIITYEIKETATSSYEKLFEEIKKSKKWWHYLTNTWIVLSEDNATAINNRFLPHLDKNINLLIFELGNDRQGWLTKKAWEWINTNISKRSN